MESQELSNLNHCVYKLNYHLVLVTKYRNKCITKEILEFLEREFSRLLAAQKCKLLEFNGEEDHVHLLLELTPKIEISKLINMLKTVTSRLVRKQFIKHLSRYYWKPYFWSKSYCIISCGNVTLEILKQYVKEQNSPTTKI